MRKQYLKILTGDDKGSLYEVSGARICLGRDSDNDIVIPNDARCSRKHAYLRLLGRQNEIFNLGKNTIIVNGKKGKKFHIKNGDIIQLGRTQISFYQENPLRDAENFKQSAAAEATQTKDRLFYELEAGVENTKTSVTRIQLPDHTRAPLQDKKLNNSSEQMQSDFNKAGGTQAERESRGQSSRQLQSDFHKNKIGKMQAKQENREQIQSDFHKNRIGKTKIEQEHRGQSSRQLQSDFHKNKVGKTQAEQANRGQNRTSRKKINKSSKDQARQRLKSKNASSNFKTPSAASQPPAYSQASVDNQSPAYSKPPAYDKASAHDRPSAYNQSPAYDQSPAYNKPPVYDKASAYKPFKNSTDAFTILPLIARLSRTKNKRPFIYLSLIGVFVWLMSADESKKQSLQPRDPAAVNQSIQQTQQQIDKQKQLQQPQQTVQFKKAQAAFIQGRRAYQQGQYDRALVSLVACLNLYPDHSLCAQYQNMAQKKKSEVIQYHMIQGRKFKEQNQFRDCIAAFQQVMNIEKNKTSLVYKEAQVNHEACEQEVKDDY